MTEEGNPSLWKMQTEFPLLQGESGAQDSGSQDFQKTKSSRGASSRNKGLKLLSLNHNVFILLQLSHIKSTNNIFSQVTIRASLSGKAPMMPGSPNQCGITVKPECFSQQSKSPVSMWKSKSNVSAARKAKTTSVSKKQDGIKTKHNLALTSLRLTVRRRNTAARTNLAVSSSPTLVKF